MIIDDKSLKKLIIIIFKDIFKLSLNKLEIKIEDKIYVVGSMDNMEVKGVLAFNNDFIDIKGNAKYGMLYFDLNKVLQEYVKNNGFITIIDNQFKINLPIKLSLNNKQIELEFI